MGNFLVLFKRQRESDKCSVNELLFAAEHLPESVETASIPQCMRDEAGKLDWEVVITLAWVGARREDSEITREEVSNSIGAPNVDDVIMELWYFYTTFSREELKERADAAEKAAEETSAEETKKPPKNQKPGAKRSGSKSK